MKPYFLVLVSIIALLQTGCVVGRRTVALPIPSIDAATAKKGVIYITSIADARTFQKNSAEPSTPSVKGNVNTLTIAQKEIIIGRQRNTYGMAMGDIALPADDSVIKRTRLLIEQGLQHRGYQISSDSNAPNTANISIDEFWAWFTPGFWSVSFEARVSCTINFKKPDDSVKVVVKGYGMNHGQVASDANWQQAYDLAFRDFLSKLDAELFKVGF